MYDLRHVNEDSCGARPQRPIRIRVLLSFVTIAVLVPACLFSGEIRGSRGGVVSGGLSTVTPNFRDLKFKYDNRLYFDGDLRVIVDALFARIAMGDTDSEKFAQDFLNPGLQVLLIYGIRIPNQPRANPQERRIEFLTDFPNEWTTVDQVHNSQIARLPISELEASTRWKARLVNSYLEFNSLRPDSIKVHFEMVLRLQVSSDGVEWGHTSVDSANFRGLSGSIQRELDSAYRAYLANNFGADTDSPQFKGLTSSDESP
jgi:hypothetical protein